MLPRHMATDKDSSGVNIFWFDLDGKIYGVKEIDGERVIIDFVTGSIMDMEDNFVVTDRMKALA